MKNENHSNTQNKKDLKLSNLCQISAQRMSQHTLGSEMTSRIVSNNNCRARAGCAMCASALDF